MSKQNEATRLVVIDCDPGIDDALALLFFLKNMSACHLLGITTVAGNVGVEYTSVNAIRICTLAEIEIPVYIGASKPLKGPRSSAATIHGRDGLAGIQLAAGYSCQRESAWDFLGHCAATHPGKIEILALGPLTNIARTIQSDSGFAGRLKGITLMGGALKGGNVTSWAEFNIHADPHAAKIVFESGIPVTMVGLDVTHSALLSHTVADEWREGRHHVLRSAGSILSGYRPVVHQQFGPVYVLHDPLAAAVFLDKSIATLDPYTIEVESRPNNEYGRTIGAKAYGDMNAVSVAVDADYGRFVEWFISSIESYGN